MPQIPYDKARTDAFNREVEQRYKLDVAQSANRGATAATAGRLDVSPAQLARDLTATARHAADVVNDETKGAS